MPYRAYIRYSRPTTACPWCGRTVRLEGWAGLLAAGGAILAALFLTVLLVDSLAAFFLVTVGLALLALALDYGSYRLLRWVPEEDEETRPHRGAAPV